MKVVKFGGSSLANGEQFKKVIAIVTAQPERQAVITSAPGKRFSDDIKVTDLLITYAEQFLNYLDTKKSKKRSLTATKRSPKHLSYQPNNSLGSKKNYNSSKKGLIPVPNTF